MESSWLRMSHKRAGVKTGEALWQAKQKCPDLVIVPPHYQLYLRFSRMARAIYAEYTDLIEPFGLDEAWIDVTGSGVFGDAVEIAETIRIGSSLSFGDYRFHRRVLQQDLCQAGL